MPPAEPAGAVALTGERSSIQKPRIRNLATFGRDRGPCGIRRGKYHWMAGNYMKYAAEEAKFGKKTAADLPVDQHQLIALCAPRLCFVSYGIVEKGDPKWVDAGLLKMQ